VVYRGGGRARGGARRIRVRDSEGRVDMVRGRGMLAAKAPNSVATAGVLGLHVLDATLQSCTQGIGCP